MLLRGGWVGHCEKTADRFTVTASNADGDDDSDEEERGEAGGTCDPQRRRGARKFHVRAPAALVEHAYARAGAR